MYTQSNALTRVSWLAATIAAVAFTTAGAQTRRTVVEREHQPPRSLMQEEGNPVGIETFAVERCLDCSEGSLRVVILRSRVTGDVSHYRAGTDPEFNGASWLPYTPEARFALRGRGGSHTVYFQVRGKSLRAEPGTLVERAAPAKQSSGNERPASSTIKNQRPAGDPGYVLSKTVSAFYAIERRITVASIGDSYAAGEGSPDRIGSPTANGAWLSEQCHRSARNGRAVAIAKLTELYGPSTAAGTEFLFKDVACSGATINTGLLGPYAGVPHGGRIHPAVPAQLDQVEAWLAENDIEQLDVLLIGIGGNDVGFSFLISRCVSPIPLTTRCDRSEEVRYTLENGDLGHRTELIGFDLLGEAFDRLAERIERIGPRHVMITEIPDPTRDENGRFCGCGGDGGCFDDGFVIRPEHLRWGNIIPIETQRLPALLPDLGASTAMLHLEEAAWVYTNVLTRLNQTFASVARRHGWIYVGGLMSDTREHGLCAPADERWFNTFHDAWVRQGDLFGSIHPNEKGYQALGTRIVERMVETLELDGGR